MPHSMPSHCATERPEASPFFIQSEEAERVDAPCCGEVPPRAERVGLEDAVLVERDAPLAEEEEHLLVGGVALGMGLGVGLE